MTAPKTVLITGTSSGFGLAAAVELARRGWRVSATMRDLSRCVGLETALAEAGVADTVRIDQLDLTDAASLNDRAARIIGHLGGRLDAVVHNAGIAVESAFEDLSDADARRIMETNFFGVLGLTRAILPVMRGQRQGRIVVVSSDSAFAGEPANSVYVGSKWAIEGWAESVAFEIAQFNLDIVLVEPGPYRTGIWGSAERAVPATSAYKPFMKQLHGGLQTYLDQTAGDPAEVGKRIADVLHQRRPNFRNPVGTVARIGQFARGKVSTSLLRWTVARYLGIDKIGS